MPPVRPALLCLVLATALAAGSAFAASSQPLDEPLLADLDGDGATETVSARETSCFGPDEASPPPCDADMLRTLYVEVADGCGAAESAPGAAGQPVKTIRLSREMDAVSVARIVDADGDGLARELVFELRAGATARGVQAKVVSFRAGPGGCIAVRKTLFSYPRPETIGRRPKGTSFASGALTIANYARERRGLELRTRDTYAGPSDPGCCPRYERVTFWRYVAARNGYAPYRTKLTKLPRRL